MLNAVDPRFVMPIFDGALAAGADYLDMAMSLSRPHPERPYAECGVKLGDEQFAARRRWRDAGRLALVGIGVEPGLSDVFARYAADELFASIDEIGVRDGANLVVEGYDFAPSFSIWTTIEECLNPPVIWERDRGWFTTEPFSEPEVFDFPEGIGPVECVNVEHEEVLLIPRWVAAERVTFKYGLGNEFIEVLKTLHKLGLDSATAGPGAAASRSRPATSWRPACPTRPASGDRMRGKTCAGTWVRGIGIDGSAARGLPLPRGRQRVVDARVRPQAVVWQTAINPVVALELLADRRLVRPPACSAPRRSPPPPFLDAAHRRTARPGGSASHVTQSIPTDGCPVVADITVYRCCRTCDLGVSTGGAGHVSGWGCGDGGEAASSAPVSGDLRRGRDRQGGRYGHRQLYGQSESGVLVRASRGVYSRSLPAEADRLRALMLRLPEGVVLGYHSAAFLHGIDVPRTDVDPRHRAGRRDCATHAGGPGARGGAARRRGVSVSGMLCAPPDRCAIDLARSVRRIDALPILDAAIRAGVCDLDDLTRGVSPSRRIAWRPPSARTGAARGRPCRMPTGEPTAACACRRATPETRAAALGSRRGRYRRLSPRPRLPRAESRNRVRRCIAPRP